MRLTSYPNLDLMLGDTSRAPSVPRALRLLAGAVAGGVIALLVLLFFAALVRWPTVLRLWPGTCTIGLAFGGLVALLGKPHPAPDPRFGEARRMGRITHLL